ncbi:MAG: MipA/OmpV family protein [Pseudomonadota bacterium]
MIRIFGGVLLLLSGAQAAAQDSIIGLTLGGGVQSNPTYFGSDTAETTFAPVLEVDRLKFGPIDLGGGEATDGFGFKGGFRFISERTPDDGAELTGLTDIDAALEIGGGIEWSDIPDGITRNWGSYSFAEARYGVIGHEAVVGEAGADLIYAPNDQLAFRFGPRLFGGDDDFTATYFGVTADEAAASDFTAFTPTGGVLSRGVKAQVNYAINDLWGVEGTVSYSEFLNDAANSPIVQGGSTEQTSIGLTLSRKLDFRF